MSTQNLLPLLEQLQLMENSLTNFMFETILKLRSLTDSKVFLLLENSERRRYCGSPELVDVFEQRGLNGLSTDVRVDLDTTTDVLIERKNRKRSRDGHRDSGNGLPTGFAEPNGNRFVSHLLFSAVSFSQYFLLAFFLSCFLSVCFCFIFVRDGITFRR